MSEARDIQDALCRLEFGMAMWAMIAFKLAGWIDWSWWFVLWPLYAAAVLGVLKEVIRRGN